MNRFSPTLISEDGAQDEGLVGEDERVGTVHIDATWKDDTVVIKVSEPRPDKSKPKTKKFPDLMRIVVWQDYGSFIHSETTNLANASGHTWEFDVRKTKPFLVQLELMENNIVSAVAPFKLLPDREQFIAKVGIRENIGELPQKLSVTSVNVDYEGNCTATSEQTRVGIKVRAGPDDWQRAYWSYLEFGSGAPWGVDMSGESSTRIAKELQNYIRQGRALVCMYQLSKADLTAILLVGRLNSFVWRKHAKSFVERTKLYIENPLVPSPGAKSRRAKMQGPKKVADVLSRDVVHSWMIKVFEKNRANLVDQAPDPAQQDLSEGQKLFKDLLANIVAEQPKELLRAINVAKALHPSDASNAMVRAGAKFTEEDMDDEEDSDFENNDRDKDDLEATWEVFKGRTLRNSIKCKKIAKDSITDGLEACKEACASVQTAAANATECNVARWQKSHNVQSVVLPRFQQLQKG
jgi:hypothetical protein